MIKRMLALVGLAFALVACGGKVVIDDTDASEGGGGSGGSGGSGSGSTSSSSSDASSSSGTLISQELLKMWFVDGPEKSSCANPGPDQPLQGWDQLRFSASKALVLEQLTFRLEQQGDASLENVDTIYLYSGFAPEEYMPGIIDIETQTITFPNLNHPVPQISPEDSYRYFTIYVIFNASGAGTWNDLLILPEDVILSEGTVTTGSFPLESARLVLCP